MIEIIVIDHVFVFDGIQGVSHIWGDYMGVQYPWCKAKKNIALFPAHRPGENFLRCHPAANQKIFFISLFKDDISLCMY